MWAVPENNTDKSSKIAPKWKNKTMHTYNAIQRYMKTNVFKVIGVKNKALTRLVQ